MNVEQKFKIMMAKSTCLNPKKKNPILGLSGGDLLVTFGWVVLAKLC
jgi:hypothetical protein